MGIIIGNSIADGSITTPKLAAEAVNSTKIVGSIIPPVGSILPFLKSLSGVPSLPSGWVECNGQTLSDADSPLNGQVIPNLNGGKYLKGAAASGATGGNATHKHQWYYLAGTSTGTRYFLQIGSASATNKGQTYDVNGTAVDVGTTLLQIPGYVDAQNGEPPYYQVVWIIRIK